MHEMSITQSLVEIIREEMVKNSAAKLRSVRLNIGSMSGVVPESLAFCFEVITADTEMAGAELLMDIIPLKGTCLECEREFEIEDYAFFCPHCSSRRINTLSGQDLSIVEIEVD